MRVVFDIDGVLADVKKYVSEYLVGPSEYPVGKLNWEAYFSHTLEFPVILPMAFLLRSLVEGNLECEIYFVTARPESNRELTVQWLRENLVPMLPPHDGILCMRPTEASFTDGGSLRNCDVKMGHIRFIAPDIIFDDDPELVEVARNEGYLVLQVHGYRETKKDAIPK